MHEKPIIQDMAAIANINDDGTGRSGEAFDISRFQPNQPIAANERAYTLVRLQQAISNLIKDASSTYAKNCYKYGTKEVDPNYISRISTNEFLFYTKEPLTLIEFEQLQNQIAIEAKKHPSAIHLILGTFAVRTSNNKVMNVAAHITCGDSPQFHFVVKNYTSCGDVRYNLPDGQGNTYLTRVFDNRTHDPSLPMPSIEVNGQKCDLSFNTIIPCQTPGGIKFLTAVEICADHLGGVAKATLEVAHPDQRKQPISHVVVSNWVDLNQSQCLTSNVMHVDPVRRACKGNRKPDKAYARNLGFGNEVTVYDMGKLSVFTLEEEVMITRRSLLQLETPDRKISISPFIVHCAMELEFLCIKKHLEINNIPYTVNSGAIIVQDADLTRDRAVILSQVLTFPETLKKLEFMVESDIIAPIAAQLFPQTSLLTYKIPSLIDCSYSVFNPALPSLGDSSDTKAVRDTLYRPNVFVRLILQPTQEAALFLNALKQRIPSATIQPMIDSSCTSVLIYYDLLNDAALVNDIIAACPNKFQQEKLNLTEVLEKLDIKVIAQTPFTLHFSDDTSFMQVKLKLQGNNISCVHPRGRNLIIHDGFSQDLPPNMVDLFSSTDSVNLLISVAEDAKKYQDLVEKCNALCKRAAQNVMNDADVQIDAFLKGLHGAIEYLQIYDDLLDFYVNNLKPDIKELETSTHIIRAVVSRLSHSDENKEKAAKIIDAFCKMPIEQRKDILDLQNPSPAALAVHKEIATHGDFASFATDVRQYQNRKLKKEAKKQPTNMFFKPADNTIDNDEPAINSAQP